MAYYPTFPDFYEDVRKLNISSLRKWGNLKPGLHSFNYCWTRGNEECGRIGVRVYFMSPEPYLELNYLVNGQQFSYTVRLECSPSNLGKGKVWFFECPKSGYRCRKLYLNDDGYFVHRSLLQGYCYEKQTYSSVTAKLGQKFDRAFGLEKGYELIYSKHFRQTYRGKPTKRFLKATRYITEAEKHSNLF